MRMEDKIAIRKVRKVLLFNRVPFKGLLTFEILSVFGELSHNTESYIAYLANCINMTSFQQIQSSLGFTTPVTIKHQTREWIF